MEQPRRSLRPVVEFLKDRLSHVHVLVNVVHQRVGLGHDLLDVLSLLLELKEGTHDLVLVQLVVEEVLLDVLEL